MILYVVFIIIIIVLVYFLIKGNNALTILKLKHDKQKNDLELEFNKIYQKKKVKKKGNLENCIENNNSDIKNELNCKNTSTINKKIEIINLKQHENIPLNELCKKFGM